MVKKKPDRWNILAAVLCVSGVGLVSLTEELTINPGDLLTLVCAFFYAAHIVSVEKFAAGKDIYIITVFQFAFAALYAWVLGFATQTFPVQDLLRPLLRGGDPVPGVGVRGNLLGALLRGPGHRTADCRLCADFYCGHLLGDQIFLPV